VIGDVNNRHLGLLNLSRDPKPALRAFHWATTLFGPGIDYINHQVHVTKRLASTAEVHTFKRLDGTILIIAWLPTIVHGQRGDPTGQTVDPRREVVSLQLPHKPRGQIAMYDQMGALQASIPAQQSIKIPLHGNATRVLIVQP
ncbi:MAG TPA: hypothetical protein VN673_10240, partial [Clostridia bacterium]|nr:hypothetical protein [Clostridia bacterium]